MKEKLYIIIGGLLIAYIAVTNKISNVKIAFSVPIIIFGVMIIIWGAKGKSIIEYINSKRALSILYKYMKIGLGAVCIILLIIESIIIFYPKHNTSNSDYILVLGAGLGPTGYPSYILQYRLNSAMKCIDDYGNGGKIVVSGGQGIDEKISEAEAMKNYLIQNKVPEDKILMEDQSSNTRENFEYSKKVIENDSGKSIEDVNVKIVTTDFHAFRSRILARKKGYLNVTNYSSPTVWYLIPVTYAREAFAVIKSVLFD